MLRVGDLVEVRSAPEILATLDERGELDNLPFMPEMLQFCGKRLTVHKVAHKLCDTISASGNRWMNNAVHLTGSRCDGSAHGGCQTACSLYWKESWLRRIEDRLTPTINPANLPAGGDKITILDRATRKPMGQDGEEHFSCQATELLRAAPCSIRFFNLRQYITDLKTGNVNIGEVLRSVLFHLFNIYQDRSKRVLPSCLTLKEGLSWGFVKGCLEGSTPTAALDLQPGELVRIKTKEEIMQTLDLRRLNRGMGFEEEMARSCGRTARVTRRVERCIDEKTGRLLTMKNPCIALEGVVCEGVYHANCPREFIPFWREIWLERVEKNPNQTAATAKDNSMSCDQS
ncbi:MAG: hypothetical protein JST02_14185 [Bacteroidetes bacterium]|nr:hypothetical protein [Bacteroidota bacterium]